ncbi:unnamed protein product [Ceratitis capitata]|uniref:(Mediterranean fruit fly) hypothetical protein n=1 Tax=Ceratitis capitata TaxID=7213 RepID=A0A811VBX1_CERCA|nr:unnamed protein product [Ceratitis capitata]
MLVGALNIRHSLAFQAPTHSKVQNYKTVNEEMKTKLRSRTHAPQLEKIHPLPCALSSTDKTHCIFFFLFLASFAKRVKATCYLLLPVYFYDSHFRFPRKHFPYTYTCTR